MLQSLAGLYQPYWSPAAQVDDLIRSAGVLHRGSDALDHIAYKGIVPARTAIAVDRYRFILNHLPRELVNGQIGPLARPKTILKEQSA